MSETSDAPVEAPAPSAPLDHLRAFVERNSRVSVPPLIPEIRLHLASEVVPLWHLTEEELDKSGLPPPFWAFAWAGGQALSRFILDHPDCVAGRQVLDFGAGSGICAIAAKLAGAASVQASDIDRFSVAAMELNAQENEVALDVTSVDLIDTDHGWDTILVGDMCYEQPLAGRIEAWLRHLNARGADVLIGDPGRTYLPKQGLEKLISYSVMTSRELEDSDVRNTSVWRVLA